MQDMEDAHEKILKRTLEKVAKEQKYDDYTIKITPISSEGANYTSMLYLATISALNKPDLKLFAKVAAMGEKFREQMFVPMFDVENYVYNTLGKIYEEIQDKYEVPDEHRFRMPKFYGLDDTYLEETLVLEDLSAQGYVTQDRLKSMGWEYTSRALEELGKWHALSIVFQEEYPEEYEVATKTLKFNMALTHMMAGALQQIAPKTLDAITDEENREKLRKFLEKCTSIEFLTRLVGPQKRPVLAHGDFAMSNIMHKPHEDKWDIILLDYQATQVGCGIRDVLFFLLTGTDEEFRGKHFHQLLDHYYEHLCLMLRRLNKDPEMFFPRKDFDYELEKNIPWAIIIAVMVLPMVTVALEDAPKVDEFDLESITSVKTSSLFKTRINGVIRDFVKWGWI